VKTLAANERFALLEVRPVTGRTHQIRAHLAAAGCAIVGDKTYGVVAQENSRAVVPPRQFLHAYRLELRRYPDNVLCDFTAPLPADLVAWLVKYLPEANAEVVHAKSSVPTG
jgi:23S rRNA-/tRNA-specific pseudouridylate synthase